MGAGIGNGVIQIRGLVKRFGDRYVLHDIDLQIDSGEMFALVGINSAGKTTIIKSLLDFASFEAGEIMIFGKRHDRHEARAELAYLPERFVPPYYLTGRDFLKYSARLHGGRYDEENALVVIDSLELDASALAWSVRRYSKGMAQKLGLAATFLANKRLLVLDEPMSGLDPKARILVKRALLRQCDTGCTVFLTTHMLADVHSLCDRLAVLHAGRIVFSGSPAACLQQFSCDYLEDAFLACIEAA
ncbi:MAG: ATP-binding cassette domain-containing protein [Gammaproteobacteria bacterium]|nr:ATP-binding cassette domain-containing protein [Gammaproteobacteria bacterium]